ncbi:Not1 N-terminal domain, CCR4-Not complex component-domain-containing protein [Thelephora terrestris]|uniref:General negative regulator of transcription subunit n=1 Tax=Thelephora terrestris TaxID=56493 RepID=A0A9P6HBA8_9AGAM|nr:Not1 N-terminal domain, CCR4-Not complex component-domain-containing protein [Thelephora terrestris]
MAARKLLTEIDRTLKRVAEGVEQFESIYEKMQNSTNQTQKEKLETDLKTQIKKLQRLRDQIKAWVANNDIKDKTALLDNRKLIETQMEKFKACEKEMKTKAFSKEGLTAAAKLDPKAQEKIEATAWVQAQVEQLQIQIEQSEAQVETLQGGVKKKGKSGGTAAERLEELEHLNDRRKWHVNRLELIMRLLVNGSLPVEKVRDLQEDVSYFVESNDNEDFEEDEGIYDELNLNEEEEKYGLALEEADTSDSEETSEADLPPRTPLHRKAEEDPIANKRDGSPVLKKATVITQRKPSLPSESKPPPPPNFAQQSMSSILKAGLPQQSRPTTLTPIRYSAAAAGATQHASSATSQPTTTTATTTSTLTSPTPVVTSPLSQPPAACITTTTTVTTSSTQDQISRVSSSPSLTHPSVTSPMPSSASAANLDDSLYSMDDSPSPMVSEDQANATTSSPHVPPKIGGSTGTSPEAPHSPKPSRVGTVDSQTPPVQPQVNGSTQLPAPTSQGPPHGHSPLPQQVQQPVNANLNMSAPMPTSQSQPQFPPGVKLQNPPGSARPPSVVQNAPVQPQTQRATTLPGSISDLVASFEGVKQKAVHRMSNLDQVHKLLEGGYSSAPQPEDTDKPKYYVPRNPYPTPSYYPQAPLPILSSAGLFSQLDVETLFYIFYYHPGTYPQYLAAKELKRQSWRFHVKYLTWFQRHSEPQAITEEYEQGVYVYFDWEGSWCQRKKSDFRFEYRYLED